MLDACFVPRLSVNRLCQQIGLDEMFLDIIYPFTLKAELIDLRKEKNFFETRMTECQTGELGWYEAV